MAEGIFRHKIKERGLEIETDSAGTGDWHVGEPPDKRMQSTALNKGIDISDLRARQFRQVDFDLFDHIYVMDESNKENVLKLARSSKDAQKVKLMLEVLFPGQNKPVPDPYFGGQQGFDHVFDLLDKASDVILNHD
jgi:protein-tyrosine phosphatase